MKDLLNFEEISNTGKIMNKSIKSRHVLKCWIFYQTMRVNNRTTGVKAVI